MKIGKLIRAKIALAPYFKEKHPPKLSYKLMKFISKIETEERFFNEKASEIINLYAERDSEGNIIPLGDGVKIKDGMQDMCYKAFAELESVEVEVPNITFTLDELSEFKLSVEDMVALDAFIIEK